MKYFHRKLNYSQMKRKYFPINVEIFPGFYNNYWLDVELRWGWWWCEGRLELMMIRRRSEEVPQLVLAVPVIGPFSGWKYFTTLQLSTNERAELYELDQWETAVLPGEKVGVVPVDQVRGGVVVGLGLSVGSHRQSPGTAVVFIRSRL